MQTRDEEKSKLVALISACFAKQGVFSLKMSAYAKKNLTQHVCKDFPSFSRRENQERKMQKFVFDSKKN